MPPPFPWAMACLDEGNSGGTCGHGTYYGKWTSLRLRHLAAASSPRSALAVLSQVPPISLALVPATRIPSTFHGTGDSLLGGWRRWQCWRSWSHRCNWINHWLCAMVVEVSIMVVMEVSVVVLVLLVLGFTIVVMMEVTIMAQVFPLKCFRSLPSIRCGSRASCR